MFIFVFIILFLIPKFIILYDDISEKTNKASSTRLQKAHNCNKQKCIYNQNTEVYANILDVNLWRQQLQAGVGKHPGIVEGSGAMLGEVLLTQVTREADDPGVLALRDVGKHPDV